MENKETLSKELKECELTYNQLALSIALQYSKYTSVSEDERNILIPSINRTVEEFKKVEAQKKEIERKLLAFK